MRVVRIAIASILAALATFAAGAAVAGADPGMTHNSIESMTHNGIQDMTHN